MIGEENRTLIVELLRDDCDLILTKYLHHSDYGIEGSEACVVQIDASGRHALVHQRVFHVGGLIIRLHVVVAAHDEIVDFPMVVEFRRRRDAVLEIRIRPTTENAFRTTENQTYTAVGNQRYVGVGLVLSSPRNHDPGNNQREYRKCY